MPTNAIQWVWFAFYTGGALFAWLWLIVCAARGAIAMRDRRQVERIMEKHQ